MIPSVKIPLMQPHTDCKVCDGKALLYGVVDFTKNSNSNVSVQLSGIPIYYYQCEECKFLFTRAFDEWDMQTFSEHIYNENYALFDTDYLEIRPRNYARDLGILLSNHTQQLRGLDYGGGNGLMARLMQEQGFNYTSWDPMSSSEARPDSKKFNFVSAIEVAEHVPEPSSFFNALDDFLAPDGVCIFTTVTTDTVVGQRLMDWWYVGPLNGHISIFSKASIAHLANQRGLEVRHAKWLHILYRESSPILDSLLAGMDLDPEDSATGPLEASDTDS